MKNLKIKAVAATLAFSILAATSCSALDKSADDVQDLVDTYMNNIVKGKSDKNADLVEDEADAFIDISTGDDDQDIVLEAIIANMSYEIGDVEASKKDEEGTVEVTIELKDISSILDGEYSSADEAADAIADIDDTTSKDFEIEVILDDDEWFISSKSTEKIADYLVDYVADIEFGALSEEAAINFVDYIYDLAASGDTDGLYEYDLYDDTDDWDANTGDVLGAYWSSADYEITVTSRDENTATVVVSGTAPDIEAVDETANSDDDFLISLLTEALRAAITETDYGTTLMYIASQEYISIIPTAASSDYEATYIVSVDEEGNFSVELTSGYLFPDFEIVDFETVNRSDYYEAALLNLVNDGIITEDQAAYVFYQQYGEAPSWYTGDISAIGTEPSSPTPSSPVSGDAANLIIPEGYPAAATTNPYEFIKIDNDAYRGQFYDFDYNIVTQYTTENTGFIVRFQTIAYYEEGTPFGYVIFYNGVEIDRGIYGMELADSTYIQDDDIYITYTDSDGLDAGDYVIIVYTNGSYSNLLSSTYFTVV